MTPEERDTLDTAWHEAGHIVGAWWGGRSIVSAYINEKLALDGVRTGSTKVNGRSHNPPTVDDVWVRMTQELAGDAVDHRRGVKNSGHHIEAALEAQPKAVVHAMWEDTLRQVDRHWPSIEVVAMRLHESGELSHEASETIRAEVGPIERTLRVIDG